MRSSQVLRTLELEGTPQERGRRHGQTLGAEIRQLRRALLVYLARLSLMPGPCRSLAGSSSWPDVFSPRPRRVSSKRWPPWLPGPR